MAADDSLIDTRKPVKVTAKAKAKAKPSAKYVGQVKSEYGDITGSLALIIKYATYNYLRMIRGVHPRRIFGCGGRLT